jgi:hypothetical protein
MIFSITGDVLYFLIVALILFVGFGEAFYLLHQVSLASVAHGAMLCEFTRCL